jgi:hypothetical protein
MLANSREEIVEIFDALHTAVSRLAELSFDALTIPERLACSRSTRVSLTIPFSRTNDLRTLLMRSIRAIWDPRRVPAGYRHRVHDFRRAVTTSW